ncbi:MAG TPA: single-stranded-DNA-specific exonuclease RecJ [Solirubrobacteraceae bacterium]|nr:single-stranded-DNA-specific exonuclease RecJ [Solirubrobacteraceae bacterium]
MATTASLQLENHPAPDATAGEARPALRVVDGAERADPVPAAVRFELPDYDLGAALALERELGIGHVLAQVLVRRGLGEAAAARAFLGAAERHDPSRMSGIGRATDAITDEIRRGGRITVHGDYDVDGVCATAIMVRALRSLGAEVDWFIPSRLEDGYGLSAATVQRLQRRGTGLIVCVDCAITAVEEVAAARAAGLRIVVCDHHAPRPDGALPDCPIVHPAVCEYPCPDLCGAAVAYKLAQALEATTADEDLELVALATVADLVPLRGENRRLVREGLRALAATTRPGLRALMAVAGVDPGSLDSGVLSFRLAPRINAAGRLRRADAALELLLCADPGRARAIASELDELNAERRAVERRILWEAEAQVSQLEAQAARAGYVLAGEGWHPGVVGIVASRIVERHHRPALLIAVDEAAGTATGSGRSIPGFDLLGALHAVAGHLERYGGHRAAAGMTLDAGAVPALRAAFEAHAASVLSAEQLIPREQAHAVVSGHELGLELAEQLEALEPCGLGNPSPRLLVAGARFADVRAIGDGRHARFTVLSGGIRARAVAFGCDGRPVAAHAQPHDATFRLQRNAYNGAVEPQLVLRHAQPCALEPIERLVARTGDDGYLEAVLAELESEVEGARAGGNAPIDTAISPSSGPSRTIIDRRGHSPLAVLADARAAAGSDGRVLALCADVSRRLAGLSERAGGFTLGSYAELERRPQSADRFGQLVALDPPASPQQQALLHAGQGFTQLAWGAAELRFAEQIHELEYGIRASLVALYRDLRDRQRAAGEELERVLRGKGPHGRSVQLAGRLIRILAELELVSLDRDLPALAIAGTAPTALDRSPSYRVYAKRYEDGKRFLSSANPPPRG